MPTRTALCHEVNAGTCRPLVHHLRDLIDLTKVTEESG